MFVHATQDDPEIPFTETDFRRRKAHPNFKEHIAAEKLVTKLGKTVRTRIPNKRSDFLLKVEVWYFADWNWMELELIGIGIGIVSSAVSSDVVVLYLYFRPIFSMFGKIKLK